MSDVRHLNPLHAVPGTVPGIYVREKLQHRYGMYRRTDGIGYTIHNTVGGEYPGRQVA